MDPAGRAYVGWASDNNTTVSKARVRALDGTWGAATTMSTATIAFPGSLSLHVTAGPKVVAVIGESTSIKTRTYDPGAGTWSGLTTAVSAPAGVETLRVASDPARTDIRVAFGSEGVEAFTAWVADPSNVATPVVATAISAVPVGNEGHTPGSAAMNSSGQAAILWETTPDAIPGTYYVRSTVCAPSNALGACTTTLLDSFSSTGWVSGIGAAPYVDRIVIAADGSAAASWSNVTVPNQPLDDAVRYATRTSGGVWSAAADVPGSGTANRLGVGIGTRNLHLAADPTGALMLVGPRRSDGFLASKAFAQAPAAPAQPSAVVGGAAGQATVSWSALTSSTGFAPITGYTAQAVQDPSKSCTTAGGTSCTISGIPAGANYTFTVAATNTAGTGTASAASTAVAFPNVPGAPTGVTGTRGNQQVALSWTAPISNGGSSITAYTASAVEDPTKSCTATTGSPIATTCTITGLANGTAYTFTVKATNAWGDSAESAASSAYTPATLPGAPTGVTGTRGNGEVLVSWIAPAANGSAITSYTVTASDPSKTCTATTGSPVVTSCTVTGLTNGTGYSFTVRATNEVGQGAASTASASVTPAAVPSTPSGVVTVRGDTSVAVTWVDSTHPAGITNYTVTATPGPVSCTATSGSTGCTLTGLTNGTNYSITVTANGADSLTSLPSAAATSTPAGLPGAPGGLTATPGDGSVVLAWSAASANGSAVIDYTVTGAPGGTCTTSGTTCTISGLQNGTTYTFTVTARNAVGTGTASAVATTAPASPEAPPPSGGGAPAPIAVGPASPAQGASVTPTAAAAPPRLSTPKGSRIVAAKVLATAGIKAPAGARIRYAIAGAGGLRVGPKNSLVAVKPGLYVVTVTVTPRRGKVSRKTITVVVR